MCQPSERPTSAPSSKSPRLWPLPPLLLVAFLPFLPTLLWLNRGYTIWYHYIIIAYFLTQSPFLRKFAILQGTGVTLGWYAVVAMDYYSHGRFFHTLYHNTPAAMQVHMLDEGGNLIHTYSSWAVMALSHLGDTIAHPLPVLLLWRMHCRAGGSLRDSLTWPVIGSTYLLSRVWSLTHTYYNFGELGLFYFGYDVYNIQDLDGWMSAYVAEGALYASAVMYKLWAVERTTTSKILHVESFKPSLVTSESRISMDSSME
jgi:hypothetical protein